MNGPSPAPTRARSWPRLAALAWAIWLGTLWWLSSMPGSPRRLPDIQFADKVAHFGYFFVGGLLLSLALRDRLPLWKHRALCILLASALIGAADEFHQSKVPNRCGNDPWDWLADVLGGSAAALVTRRKPRRVDGLE